MRVSSAIGPVLLCLSCIAFASSAEDRVKRTPWQSYHWEEEKEKRPYNSERNAGDYDTTPWASHEFDKKWASHDFDKKWASHDFDKKWASRDFDKKWASRDFDKKWASYDLRSNNNMINPEKRDPWAYSKTDLLNYMSRRGKSRFIKASNKRTDEDQMTDLLNSDINNFLAENVPAKREARSLERTLLEIASKRQLGRVKEPTSVHPVNMGMGQHAAGYALDTYSQLLANEQRRLQEGSAGNRPGGAPVRFVGK